MSLILLFTQGSTTYHFTNGIFLQLRVLWDFLFEVVKIFRVKKFRLCLLEYWVSVWIQYDTTYTLDNPIQAKKCRHTLTRVARERERERDLSTTRSKPPLTPAAVL